MYGNQYQAKTEAQEVRGYLTSSYHKETAKITLYIRCHTIKLITIFMASDTLDYVYNLVSGTKFPQAMNQYYTFYICLCFPLCEH